MLTHRSQTRVRYAETDQMGYVYYGNYATFYEIGRVELLRSLGVEYKELEMTHNVCMPVMSMSTRYLRPAKYDDLIVIETTIDYADEREIRFSYSIYNERSKLINKGETSLCYVDMASFKRVSWPPHIEELLKPHFAEVAQ